MSVALMMYRIGREITLLRDEFDKLKPMADDLETKGVQVTFLDPSKEDEIRAVLEKHGGIRSSVN